MGDLGLLPLLLLVVVAGTVLILATRAVDQRRRDRDRKWLLLRFPTSTKADRVLAFLATLGGLPRAWLPHRGESTVVFQVVAHSDGIAHYMGVPRGQLSYVIAQLRASIVGIHAEESDPPSLSLDAASELRLSDAARELRADDPGGTTTSLLAALQPLHRGEAMTMQWLVAPAVPAPIRSDGSGINSSLQLIDQVWRGTRKPDPEVVKAARDKNSGPMFRAVGRVGVVGGDSRRQAHLLWRLVGLLHSLRRPGTTLRRRFLPGRVVGPRTEQARTPWFAYPVRLSATELLSLIAWPIEGPQLQGLHLSGSRELMADPAIPRAPRVLAEATFPGSERPLALPPREAVHHLHALGPTGVGKSTLLGGLILQDIAAGRATVVVDPKGDLVADVADRIPKEHQSRVIVLDPTDDERPVGLNLLAGAHDAPELISDQVVAIFHGLYSSVWGVQIQDVLHASVLTLAHQPGATLVELPTLLTNDAFRRRLVAQIDDPIGLAPFWAAYERMKPAERAQALGPIFRRLRPLLLRRRVRAVIGQPEPTFTMADVISKPMVLLVSLAKGTVGPEAASLIGSLVISQLWNAIQGRAAINARLRKPAFVYVDEVQDYLNLPVDVSDVLTQARGFGVGMVLAHQHLAQLPAALRQAVMANARSRVVFQTSADDAAPLARQLGGGLAPEDLQSLEAYQVYASLFAGGRVRSPASAKTLPLPPATGSAALVRELSRQRFGRDRASVEAAILERQQIVDTSGPIGRKARSQ